MGVTVHVAAGLVVGLATGVVFFGGLALTVRSMARSERPAAVVLVSLVVRLAAVAGALFLVVQLSGLALVAALAGLLVARLAITATALRDPARRSGGGASWT